MRERLIQGMLHEMVCVLADKYLNQLTPAEIVKLAPQDYGHEVTDAHRMFCWDKFYDDIATMEPFDIFKMYEMYIKERLSMREAIDRAERARGVLDQLVESNVAHAQMKRKLNS